MSGAVATIHDKGAALSPGNRRYSFDVSRFQSDALFNFSKAHNLFGISDGNSSLAIYDLGSWRKRYQISIPRFNNQVAFHPKNPHILAVNSDRLLPDRKKTFRIELLDVENVAKNGKVAKETAVYAVLEESGWTQRLLFHPDGNHLASLIGGKVHLWDMEKRERVAVFEPAEA